MIEATCPACAKDVELRVQTHVASSYSGDASGRFFDRDYRLGQPMAWWPVGDARRAEWRETERAVFDDASSAEEACYASCSACDAELCVVARWVSALAR